MACGGCPGGGGARIPATAVRRTTGPPPPEELKDYVMVEYTGAAQGAMTYAGPSKQHYRFSSLPTERQKYVRRDDAEYFGGMIDFRVLQLEPRKEAPVAVG